MRIPMILLALLTSTLMAQNSLPALKSADKAAILDIMAVQEKAWNEGKIEEFMNGYWESDSLMFVGKGGVTYGYQNTLSRYKRGYPDRRAMGTLTFDILHVTALSKTSALVIGKWHLDREDGDLEGHFSLTWRKIRGQWVIVVDHSS